MRAQILFITLDGGLKLGLYERTNLAKDASLPLGQASSTEFSLGIPATPGRTSTRCSTRPAVPEGP